MRTSRQHAAPREVGASLDEAFSSTASPGCRGRSLKGGSVQSWQLSPWHGPADPAPAAKPPSSTPGFRATTGTWGSGSEGAQKRDGVVGAAGTVLMVLGEQQRGQSSSWVVTRLQYPCGQAGMGHAGVMVLERSQAPLLTHCHP